MKGAQLSNSSLITGVNSSRSHDESLGENGVETSPIQHRIAEEQNRSLKPLKEDLADWIGKLTGKTISADNLLDELQTGALLCELANLICSKVFQDSECPTVNYQRRRPKSAYIKPSHHSNHSTQQRSISVQGYSNTGVKLPDPPRYRSNAQPGSFLARDNAANFIEWCRRLGVDETCLFESEGLVLQKQPRNIILCLLEVARKSTRLGLPAPELIKLEEELDREERIYGRLDHPGEAGSPPLSMSLRERKKVLKLDDAVHRVVDGPPFEGQVDVTRVGEGRYKIEGKTLFVRMLRGHHVMVRVGGGWDTLQNYILTHDPSRFIPHTTPKTRRPLFTSINNTPELTEVAMRALKRNKDYFVPITGRYYSTGGAKRLMK